ncbi:MAG: TIGR00282 family metallophosphoesterase [Oligoflexia bacterium]|nr:TIGR00282 family metallophosphoesterase [Oligoflexia bacterium]
MNILFLGDIVGSPGRNAIKKFLPLVAKEQKINLVIANGENAAGGLGLTPVIADELYMTGIDILTSGNHIWKHKEILNYLDKESKRLIRPCNYPDTPEAVTPGSGFTIYRLGDSFPEVMVINALGRLFIDSVDCPFRAVDSILKKHDNGKRIIIVDFHAEATSEKIAMGWFLDGRVTAVIGTHTHVQTADERLLPGGTAYISDVGMCGSMDTVIGVDKDIIIQKMLSQRPIGFKFPSVNIGINGVIVEIDPKILKPSSIKRVMFREND